MSDDEVRRLERAWHASRADADGALWLRARERAGELPPGAVHVLARVGFGPAMELLGPDAPPPAELPRDVRGLPLVARLWDLLLDLERRGGTWAREAGVVGVARAVLEGPTREAFETWARRGADRGPPSFEANRLADRLARWLSGRCEGAGEVLALAHFALGSPHPRADLWGGARGALLAAALGDHPVPEWATRARVVGRLRLMLARDATVTPPVLEQTATWLRDAAGSVRVRSLDVTIWPVPLPSPGSWSRSDVDALHGALPRDPADPDPFAPTPVVVVATCAEGPDGFVARHDGRMCAVWLDRFCRERLRAPLDLLLGHLALKKALVVRLEDRVARPPVHDPDVGCLFDLCRDKHRIDARLRTGAMCGSCRTLMHRQGRVSYDLLSTVDAVLEAGRQRLLAIERA